MDDVDQFGAPCEPINMRRYFTLLDELKMNQEMMNNVGKAIEHATPEEKAKKIHLMKSYKEWDCDTKKQLKRFLAWHPGTPHDKTIFD